MRPVCKICNQRPAAVNYLRKGQTYYRSICDFCLCRKKHLPTPVPKWQTAGYKKKSVCDRCGFRSKYQSQILVMHVDGNSHNNNNTNLRTVCLNCVEEVKRLADPWTVSALQEDYRYSHKDRSK